MGAACCCLRGDYEDYLNPNSAVYRNCLCLRCFAEHALNVYASVFRRGQQQHAPLPISVQVPPDTSLDNSLCDMYRSPPRPLPYDSDPRYFQLHRENSIHEKGSSHSHEDTETQPLRSNMEIGSENYKFRNKLMSCDDGMKGYGNKCSLKVDNEKSVVGFAHIYSSSSEDEDVCPTCLDEYTPENPKIITKCCHHFHLGCIYEWMERSESCPVCGKVMEFDETQ